jgi:hypothetical protein
MVIFWRNFKNKKVKNIFLGLPAFLVGVPAEKAGGHFVSIFFSDKNLKKGFSLLSLTQIELKMNNFN